MKRRDKKSLPFAVCTKNVGRENKAKYERCVMKVKATVNEGKLCPKGKAAAKRKFSVYPSAYANMYASAVCSGKVTPGGKKKNEAYERLGSLLIERKGTMPKNFSVKSGDKSAAGGLTAKGVARYRAANPGSKLKTAVTTKPSKLKKGSKSAKRRKSFCARMGGMKKRLTSSKTANDPNSRINKALRKWNC
jgi:hypothetical protein